jgi:hypothetical protein
MRYSIRELMLITVIVALVVGWGIDRRRLLERDAERDRRFILLTESAQQVLLEREVERLSTETSD